MTKPVTFRDIAVKTLETVKIPLTAVEIWEKANELKLLGDFETTGKTPWQTISARCYTDIAQNGDDSVFIQVGKNPTRFFLRKLESLVDQKQIRKLDQVDRQETQDDDRKNAFKERDLHPLLVFFAYSNSYFKAHVKTIYHEISAKKGKGANEWLHPDLTGVYFPFRDYCDETRKLQQSLSVSSVKLFSFEMKVRLNFANLRQAYFQAVSNSSWANEGYLVTLDIPNDPSFQEELRRLNNSFGIGVIQLDPENIDESDILFPSRIKSEIDWDTANRLAEDNPDFADFLKSITDDCMLNTVKSKYDEVLGDDKMKEYIAKKQIKRKTA